MSDKDEIFEYVMNNPENTNPAILKGMLDDLDGGSDGSGSLFIVHMIEVENNKKESGGGVAVPSYKLDKTYDDIVAADVVGKIVMLANTDWGIRGYLTSVSPVPGNKSDSVKAGIPYVATFITDDAGYPAAWSFFSETSDGVLVWQSSNTPMG